MNEAFSEVSDIDLSDERKDQLLREIFSSARQVLLENGVTDEEIESIYQKWKNSDENSDT